MIQRVLFVCTGNTCRSPLAEGLCRKKAGEAGLALEVRSAGVSAMEGIPVSRHSADILREEGCSVPSTSQPLHDPLIQWADLILTMTTSHKRVVIQRHPEAVDKVYTLKEYAENDPVVLQSIREREHLLSDIHLKRAMGQFISAAEERRLMELDKLIPDFDIMDPYGGSLDDYRHCASEIQNCLDRLLMRIQLEA